MKNHTVNTNKQIETQLLELQKRRFYTFFCLHSVKIFLPFGIIIEHEYFEI